MEIVPVGDLMRQLILAFGAALLVGNLAVVIRERYFRKPSDTRRKPNWAVVIANIAVGAILSTWGVVSIVAAG